MPALPPTPAGPAAPPKAPGAPAKPGVVAAPANTKPTDPRLTDKRYKLIEATMRRYGYQGHALIETLHTAQESFGYLDDFTLEHVARSLHLPFSKVLGVATFYNIFKMKPSGEHTCVVCTGTACYIKGANKLVAALEKRFGIKNGGTTPDKKFSLLTARCFGSCAMAPVVVVDGETLGKLTEDAVIAKAEAVIAK